MTQVTRDPLRVRKVRGVSRPFGLRPKRIRILGGGQIFYSQGDHYAILRIGESTALLHI